MQSSLDNFEDGESPDENELRGGPRLSVIGMDDLAPNAEPFNDDSCPWCCCPDVSRNERDQLVCEHCNALIPEDAPWYQAGGKVVI